MLFFFFFKQKTAYEIYQCDWSSDVCSSDLWIGSDGNTLPRLESWQVMHPLPYGEVITEDVYGKLFKDVGRNEESVQCYFSARAARLGESPVLAFDSTTISTYSENQSEARQGFNKDGEIGRASCRERV